MLTELAQWITPGIVILGFLFTARTIRNQRVEMESRMDRMESRMDRMESRLTGRIDGVESRLTERIDGVEARLTEKIDGVEARLTVMIDGVESRLAARINGLESHYSDLRDRMGRVDGTLGVLRKSLAGTGRGTAA